MLPNELHFTADVFWKKVYTVSLRRSRLNLVDNKEEEAIKFDALK